MLSVVLQIRGPRSTTQTLFTATTLTCQHNRQWLDKEESKKEMKSDGKIGWYMDIYEVKLCNMACLRVHERARGTRAAHVVVDRTYSVDIFYRLS